MLELYCLNLIPSIRVFKGVGLYSRCACINSHIREGIQETNSKFNSPKLCIMLGPLVLNFSCAFTVALHLRVAFSSKGLFKSHENVISLCTFALIPCHGIFSKNQNAHNAGIKCI